MRFIILSPLFFRFYFILQERKLKFFNYARINANEGQSLRFQVSSFNVHFFPLKRVIILKEAKGTLCPAPLLQETVLPTKLEPAGLSGQHIGLCPDHWLDLILGSPNQLSPWSCLITYPTDKPSSATWSLHYYIMFNQGSYFFEFFKFHDFTWLLETC